jgi:transcriptional regulator with XRE-family HTH domain
MAEAKIASQSDLSRLSGVPQPTINRLLKKESIRGPESTTVIKLARALNVSFVWLMHGDERAMDIEHAIPKSAVVTTNFDNLATLTHEQNQAILKRALKEQTLQVVSPDEKRLLLLFRNTTDEGRKLILSHAGLMPTASSADGVAHHKL